MPWPILAAERASLEQLDIPYFGCRSDSRALTVGLPQRLEDYFQQPSYVECITRIQRLSEAGLALQLEMIRGAIYCSVTGTHTTSTETSLSKQSMRPRVVGAPVRLNFPSLERGARAVVELLRQRSIRGPRGEIDWVGVSYLQKAGRFQVRLLGENLFDGRCGVALFLAAHGYVANDPSSRDLALELLQPLRQRLQSAKRDGSFGSSLTIGGAMGLGSLIYSLVKIARFVGDPVLLNEAGAIAEILTPAKIAADQDLDVMAGAAGAILSLMAFYETTKESRFLDQARACGEHLAKTRAWYDFAAESGPTDQSLRRKPTIGFAHGTAGICYSLIRLYSVTHEPLFLRAAEDGLEYERARFKLSAMRASTYRTGDEVVPSGLMGSWCNGIPGISLARLGCFSTLQGRDVEEELAAGLQITESWPREGIDHVCCGGFGRVEVLLVADEKLSRPRFRATAGELAAFLMDRAQGANGYRLFGGSFGSPLFKPSFFQGAAGIGYELLRVAHPAALPSVLLWE